jgi:lysozyme family protein
MADFQIAYKRTGVFEGGYSNLPNDRGGPTWKGIARNYHPGWEGWPIVDRILAAGGGEKELRADAALEVLASTYIKTVFWDTIRGDVLGQWLAEDVFDAHFNGGNGGVLLQRALNVMNTVLTRDGGLLILYPQLKEDGNVGPVTVAAYQILERRGDEESLYWWFQIARGEYQKACANSEKRRDSNGVYTQRGFSRSWVRRIAGRYREQVVFQKVLNNI